MKRICVIDGQGGGIGSTIIRRLKDALGESVEIIALGTNAIATAQMLKARANRGASGENAIVRTIESAHVVLGPLGIVLAHAMMGEVTPKMAEAVAKCSALKLLLPLSQENVIVVGSTNDPLPHLVDEMIVVHLKNFLYGNNPN
jgi:NAD(P)-dependent dehydrogenase (short-subunit alcohol dehydrogenase family)